MVGPIMYESSFEAKCNTKSCEGICPLPTSTRTSLKQSQRVVEPSISHLKIAGHASVKFNSASMAFSFICIGSITTCSYYIGIAFTPLALGFITPGKEILLKPSEKLLQLLYAV